MSLPGEALRSERGAAGAQDEGAAACARAGASPSGSGARTPRAAVCKVPGCTQPVSLGHTASTRYRVCPLHLRTLAIEIDGSQQRFCQKCGRRAMLPLLPLTRSPHYAAQVLQV
jgi:hypothetical protein